MLKNLGQRCQCKGRSDFLKGKVISSFFHAFHGNVRIKSCEQSKTYSKLNMDDFSVLAGILGYLELKSLHA